MSQTKTEIGEVKSRLRFFKLKISGGFDHIYDRAKTHNQIKVGGSPHAIKSRPSNDTCGPWDRALNTYWLSLAAESILSEIKKLHIPSTHYK